MLHLSNYYDAILVCSILKSNGYKVTLLMEYDGDEMIYTIHFKEKNV